MSTFSGDETAPFFGFLGAAAALVFSCMGAAYGTAKSGVGVASMGVMRPELVMKSIVPVVMAGVLGIYGLIIAVIISTGINPKAKSYYLFDGYAHLSSGLACGLAGLSAGMAIGIVGDAGVRANAQQPKLFVGMILILIFAEALALYGLIVGIILSSRAGLPQIRVTFLDLYYISIISHWNLLVLLSYGQLRESETALALCYLPSMNGFHCSRGVEQSSFATAANRGVSLRDIIDHEWISDHYKLK
ncbi:V-type proton ATPase 16 kDa proteolipid [Musa troglodytarum]|uniref:V-type proton ATPase proteolipid subunit n=1 Tax=Musa troglodytarum TaxID=320322 RepID=A0A9E7K1U4_9LILI|nr:V-type proton ATPase 16 kDa proteolipid [Musa troglodytarum]